MKHQLKIVTKINALLAFNSIIPVFDFSKKSKKDPNRFDNIMKAQEKLINELKVIAKANKTLLGRVMHFPLADSYALYVITEINATNVQVSWIRWNDAWQDDRLGDAGSLPLEYAEQQVCSKDRIEEYFNEKEF